MIDDFNYLQPIVNYHIINRLLKLGKPFNLKIQGTSMHPYLRHGDSVIILCNEKNVRKGDLVLIDWYTKFIVHRLIDEEDMITKGDNLQYRDPSGLKIICRAIKII